MQTQDFKAKLEFRDTQSTGLRGRCLGLICDHEPCDPVKKVTLLIREAGFLTPRRPWPLPSPREWGPEAEPRVKGPSKRSEQRRLSTRRSADLVSVGNQRYPDLRWALNSLLSPWAAPCRNGGVVESLEELVSLA